MIELREMRTGAPAPNFRLMAAHGGEVELIRYRRRQPVLLIFVGESGVDRLPLFVEAYPEFRVENVEILAIVRASLEQVQTLQAPFPILADADGAVHRGFLGADPVGQILLDRYHVVQVKESGSDATKFMSPQEALEWAVFGEVSCSSTGIAHSPQ